MRNNVILWLENAAAARPDKVAFVDEKASVTFSEMRSDARALACKLLDETEDAINIPVAVLLPKSVACLRAFFAVSYSGNFYSPLDVSSPKARLDKIITTLKPGLVVTSSEYLPLARSLGFSREQTVLLEEANPSDDSDRRIASALSRKIDTDPLYVLFTSGSTGVPKGVTICHRSVVDYIDWVCSTFGFSNETHFGNQAPFYFDNSILDIYCTLKAGACLTIIPEKLFIFPIKLIEFLNDNKINTIFWVPSALIHVANSGVFEKALPRYLQKVLFCGEVMPNRQLNVWRRALGKILFANLYGPTEITDACTYFIVDREMSDDEPLPIGWPCDNTDILVLGENLKPVAPGERGELCVRGTSLSHGYYNNPGKTGEAFIQNPLNAHYPELIYKTGDLVKYNDRGELIYLCRKDFQIKHMGHRIEIGEIETAVMALPGMDNGCIVYDEAGNKIVLFYQSQILGDKEVLAGLRGLLPKYMLPNKMVRMQEMPLNPNGKIDRVQLKNSLIEK